MSSENNQPPEEEPPPGPPPPEEDLDSDVGTIFSDEEDNTKLDDLEDDSFDSSTDTDSDSDGETSLNKEPKKPILDSDSEYEEDADKCPICLTRFTDQEVGTPERCEHQFCLRCIVAWSKVHDTQKQKMPTCPVDREQFAAIIVKNHFNGKAIRSEPVKISTTLGNENHNYDSLTYCEVCGSCEREETLLLCDGCDLGYHLACLTPPLEYVPIEDWFCPQCVGASEEESDEVSLYSTNEPGPSTRRPLPRRSRARRYGFPPGAIPASIRIPRTGQTQRLVQSVLNSFSPPLSQPETRTRRSVPPVAESPAARAPRRQRVTRKKRKTRKRKSVTASAKSGIRKRRSKRRKTRTRRVATNKPTTARRRIAHQLGIVTPRPGQATSSSALNSLRYSAGITPLRMFGSAANDLSDLVESWSDEEGPTALARMSSVRLGATLKGPPEVIASSSATNCDVLGGILKKQYILLNDKNLQIARDGTLVPSISSSNLPDIASSISPPPSHPSGSGSSRQNFPFSFGSSHQSAIRTRGVANGQDSNHSQSFNVIPTATFGSSNGDSSSSSSYRESSSGQSTSTAASNSQSGSAEQSLSSSGSGGPIESLLETQIDEINDDEFDIYSDIEVDQLPETLEIPDKTDCTSPMAIFANGSERLPPVTLSFRPHASAPANTPEPGMGVGVDPMVLAKLSSSSSRSRAQDSSRALALPLCGHSSQVPHRLPPTTIRLTNLSLNSRLPPAAAAGKPDDKTTDMGQTATSVTDYNPSDPNDQGKRKVPKKGKSDSESPPPPPPPKLPGPPRDSDVPPPPPPEPNDPQDNGGDTFAPMDLGAIPMPTDEARRPVIHFSIPTRHKLLPISSLMKRRGVHRKDSKMDSPVNLNFNSEVAKAFGPDTLDDRDLDEADLPKISLVAEIFGSDNDDDDDDEGPPVLDPMLPAPDNEGDSPLEKPDEEAKAGDSMMQSGLWKTLPEEVPPVEDLPTIEQDEDEFPRIDGDPSFNLPEVDLDEEPEIIEIVTINHNAPPPRRLFFGGTRGFETISESDSDIEVLEMSQSVKDKSADKDKGSSGSSSSKSRSQSPDIGRKRRHSHSSDSFCEEGEIVDANKKNRKDRRNNDKGDVVIKGAGQKDKTAATPHSSLSGDEGKKKQSDKIPWKIPLKKSNDRDNRNKKPTSDSITTGKEKQGDLDSSTRDKRGRGKRSNSKGPNNRSRSRSRDSWQRGKSKRNNSSSSDSGDSARSSHRTRLGHSRSPSKSPGPIRSRSSLVSNKRGRSDSRTRDSQKKKRQNSSRSRSSSPSSRNRKSRYAKESDLDKRRKSKGKYQEDLLKTINKKREKERKGRQERKLFRMPKPEEITKSKGSRNDKGERRRRKRDRSLSPVKAIVADGDSIVVSLSFQKDSEQQKIVESRSSERDRRDRNRRSNNKRLPESSRYKSSSSAKSNYSRRDAGESSSENTERRHHEREVATKVTSSGDGSRILGRYSNDYRRDKPQDNLRHKSSTVTTNLEIQMDSLVTSTRDSCDPAASTDPDDCANSAGSPPLPLTKPPEPKPVATVTSSGPSPRIPGVTPAPPSVPHLASPGIPLLANAALRQNAPGPNLNERMNTLPLIHLPPHMPTALKYPPGQVNLLNPVLASVASALLAVHQQTTPGLALINQGNRNSPPMMISRKSRYQPDAIIYTEVDPLASPISPNSSDGDDLFEPPTEQETAAKRAASAPRHRSPQSLDTLFNSLFGAEPPNPNQPTTTVWFTSPNKKVQSKEPAPSTSTCDITLNEDVPSSAVELSVQEKLIKKLNRQERVVEEVKLSLKPHYVKKHIDKDEYKDILRRAVPKVCHSKTGEINPVKINELVGAYVRKFRYTRTRN